MKSEVQILSPRPIAPSLAGRICPAGGTAGLVGTMNPSFAAAEILVEGRVQGVGYRAWARYRASLLGLAGYVMNLADGRVRVHVEGDRSVIEMFVSDLGQGPRLARVERATVRWLEPTRRFSDFDVRDTGAVPDIHEPNTHEDRG